MADERSVDVDEGRDHPPAGGSGPPIAGELSPVQRAYGRYATHFLKCPSCRSVDDRCEQGEQLWRDYEASSDATRRQLRGA
jgi:ubiquitin